VLEENGDNCDSAGGTDPYIRALIYGVPLEEIK